MPECIHQNHIFRVRFSPDRICHEFAAYQFGSAYGKAYFAAHAKQTTGIACINRTVLGGFPFRLPPLAEQRRLAGELREKLAAVTEARAALQSQIKAAAAGWVQVALAEVAEMLPASSISNAGDAEVRVVTSACLSESGFSATGIKAAKMKRSDAERAVVSAGEILIARSNTAELVGRSAVVPPGHDGLTASDLTIRLAAGERLHPQFAARFLAHLQVSGYWKEKAGGASDTMKKITRGQLNALPIPLPPLPEQRAIAERLDGLLSGVADLRSALEARLASLERLPGTLLREVFGG